MVVYINNGLPYIVMHVSITSIVWTVVDNPLGAGLILVIVNMLLKIYYIHTTIKKLKHINLLLIHFVSFIINVSSIKIHYFLGA